MNQLREVRETSFLSLQEIAIHTQIPEDYLQAIEDENFSDLTEKDYIIRQYIRTYTNFLEVDPTPILEAYKKALTSSRLASSTTLPSRKREKQSNSVSFFYKFRYHLIALGIVLLMAVITWVMKPSDTPITKSTPKQKITNIAPNKDRPVFLLQKLSKAFPNSETWMISQVDSLHVVLQAKGKVGIRIRENGTKGDIVAEKTMSNGETIDLSNKKWIVIRLDNPKLTMLKINDVLIDTASHTSSYIYEFKMNE